jgi:alkanesulfonate monooxygenase SsuD/methylene tetrahydromethanopterin reductase-like flavin-dependent oxidoreductase (luciferase family)
MLARREPKTFAMLLRAVLPMQLNADFNAQLNQPYETLEEAMAAARQLGLPDTKIYELKDYRRLPPAEAQLPPEQGRLPPVGVGGERPTS